MLILDPLTASTCSCKARPPHPKSKLKQYCSFKDNGDLELRYALESVVILKSHQKATFVCANQGIHLTSKISNSGQYHETANKVKI